MMDQVIFSRGTSRKTIKRRLSMKKIRKAAVVLLLCAAITALPALAEFALDGQTENLSFEIAKGVTLTHAVTAADSVYGLQNFNIVEFDPAQLDLYLNVTGGGRYANDRSPVSTIIKNFAAANPDLTPVAAVNGDLWMMGSAHARVEGSGTSYGGYSDAVVKKELTLPRGFNAYGGELICSAYMYTETPYEGEFWSFGMTSDGQAVIGCPTVDISVSVKGREFTADGLNRLPANDSLVVYTDRGCLSNYALDDALELLVDVGYDYTVTDGSVLRGTVIGVFDENVSENPTVSETKVILTARGTAKTRLAGIGEGDEIAVSFTVGERYGRNVGLWKKVTDAVGGHMPFVVDGIKNETGVTKGYPSTIIGIKNDGRVVVIANDGRQKGFSLGLDFNDYAFLADELDLASGLILDGGGSTDMVVLDGNEYKVVNKPSDGRERSVENAVILSVGPARERTKNNVRLPVPVHSLTSLFFKDARAYSLLSCNIQTAMERTAEGAKIYADKYNGDGYFNLRFGYPQTTADALSSAVTRKYPAVDADEYPYIVLDMKVETSDAAPVQFQTVYVSAGDKWAASVDNFVCFNNLFNDGRFHTYIIDTTAQASVTGQLNLLRIGYLMNLNEAKVGEGDGIVLRSVRLARSAAEAEALAADPYLDPAPEPNPFTDVPDGKWFTEGVLYCYKNGYMTGTSETAFAPNAQFTRAMFVTVLAKIDGADAEAYSTLSFADVAEGRWYTKTAEWAYQNGYTSGIGTEDGKPVFGWNQNVTRQQLAQFFYTYSQKKGFDVSASADLDKYADKGDVAAWAETAVKWAIGVGLISGTGEDTLSPRASATRAQVALITRNYVEKLVK